MRTRFAARPSVGAHSSDEPHRARLVRDRPTACAAPVVTTTLAAPSKRARSILASDLKGTARLAVDATVAISNVVEAMHGSIVRLPWARLEAQPRTRGITGLVYRNIRTVTGWVGSALDHAIDGLQPLLDRVALAPVGAARDGLVAALNGIIGDHLHTSGNPLATPMSFRRDGADLERADGGRQLLLIHGLCMHDAQWRWRDHDHGAALARDLGYCPAYLRYNSGLHVSTNGRALADRLEAWTSDPVRRLDELAIVGFSLGGLVARSAFHYGEQAGHRWTRRVRHMIFLGTPHQGSPLERGGAWMESVLRSNRYSAPLAVLGRLRSAGITDLRHGSLVDEEWRDAGLGQRTPRHATIELPRGVHCAALAASKGRHARDLGDRLLGDGLIPVASALGRDVRAAHALALSEQQMWTGYAMNHLDLLSHREAYSELKRQLQVPVPRRPKRSVVRSR